MKRRAFLAAAATLPAARRALASDSAVSVGLERLATAVPSLRGRRVGLLAHAASVTADGRHAIDVLRSARVDLVRLFGPEHGLRGRAAAGEAVTSGLDAASGLRVVSLYGQRSTPSAQDLQGLDVLVVDLQDAGVRFYTYASTMLLCLEAAAAAGLAVVVLDRPNPLGGVRVDGPERDPARPFSLVSLAPGPLVHGLTLGELARFANARLRQPARLVVVEMQGWSRSMTWQETGRPWTVPSPNLRSAEACLAYPGTCLLEATNVSEGRGTEAAFLLLGAPWLDAEAIAREAGGDGFALEPAAFTPVASPAAAQPKHAGVACRGVRVRVTDTAVARPWALGLRLLVALRRRREFAWTRDGGGLDTLTGSSALRSALERGDGVDAILASEAPAVERWREARKAALLY